MGFVPPKLGLYYAAFGMCVLVHFMAVCLIVSRFVRFRRRTSCRLNSDFLLRMFLFEFE